MVGINHLFFLFSIKSIVMAGIGVCILEGSSDVKGTIYFEDLVNICFIFGLHTKKIVKDKVCNFF